MSCSHCDNDPGCFGIIGFIFIALVLLGMFMGGCH